MIKNLITLIGLVLLSKQFCEVTEHLLVDLFYVVDHTSLHTMFRPIAGGRRGPQGAIYSLACMSSVMYISFYNTNNKKFTTVNFFSGFKLFQGTCP